MVGRFPEGDYSVNKLNFLTINVKRVGLLSIVHYCFHVLGVKSLEFSFLWTQLNMKSLTECNRELKEAEELEEAVGE